jgi:hypothetical protein
VNGALEKDQWSHARVAAAGFVALFIVIQLTIPLVMLAVRGGPGTAPAGELPLSWQMYTVVPPIGDLVMTKADGSVLTFDAEEALGTLGSRMAYDPDILKAACGLDQEAASVTITIVDRHRTAQC